jgi:hypothetical protein
MLQSQIVAKGLPPHLTTTDSSREQVGGIAKHELGTDRDVPAAKR